MRTCFFVSRIGEPDSSERKFSDKLLKHIVCPLVLGLDYEAPLRADQITTPGTITSQVFEQLWTADLVVADLTGANANVFYELAVRHLSKKPFVQMIEKGEKLPFDVAPERTIHFGFDIEEVGRAKDSLEKMIKTAEAHPLCDSTLSTSIEFTFTKEDVPVQKAIITDILSHLQEIQQALREQSPAALFNRIAVEQQTLQSLASAQRTLPVEQHPVYRRRQRDQKL